MTPLASHQLLFSWRDVRHRLEASDALGAIRFEIDPLELRLYSDDETAAVRALESALGLAFDPGARRINLVRASTGARSIPVDILPLAEALPVRPRVSRPLWSTGRLEDAPQVSPEPPAIVSFFSFKGGVGRTTSCFATLTALLGGRAQRRVLFIDADLEAPGLSWNVDPRERLSWVDALSLVHDCDDWRAEALPLIAEQISISAEGLEMPAGRRQFFFMPAVRSMAQLDALPVTPEQVVRRHQRAWVIGDLLVALGERLQLDVILVDLRAGLTEFSSPLLLDPRVQSVLVTSCARQSVAGTVRALQLVESRSARPSDLHVLVNQVPPDGDALYEATEFQITEAWVELEAGDGGSDPPRIMRADFAQELIAFDDLREMAERLPGTRLGRESHELAELLLPVPSDPRAEGDRAPDERFTTREIAQLAKRFEYAEENAELGLLPTPPLISVVRQPPGRLPTTVVLGSKGAGKTFAWGQMVVAETFARFAEALDLKPPDQDALFFPLLAPAQRRDPLNDAMRRLEDRVVDPSTETLSPTALGTRLKNADLEEGEGLTFWIRAIAERLGLPPRDPPSLRALEKVLEERDQRIILIVDGIEDALQIGPRSPIAPGQRAVLRSLLIDLVNELRDLGAARLGLIVFVRRDLARAAIPQNFGQFESRHRETALSWAPEDALRLTLWLLDQAGWRLMDPKDAIAAPYDELAARLHPFWDEKLGGGKKEAYSDRWVIAALSDLNGVFQARDLVRLVHFASNRSPTFPLNAKALREAVEECSKKKVDELETEVEQLRPLFQKLRGLDDDARTIPIQPEAIELDADEIEFLQEQGVLFFDEQEEAFYLPEIIRHGLDFTLARRGRARVLALQRKAARIRR